MLSRFSRPQKEPKNWSPCWLTARPIPSSFPNLEPMILVVASRRLHFQQAPYTFKHGAKSEPGNSDDLRWFLERRIEEIRKSWLEGIVKVVEAPAGARVQVITSAADHNPPRANGRVAVVVSGPLASGKVSVYYALTSEWCQQKFRTKFRRHKNLSFASPYWSMRRWRPGAWNFQPELTFATKPNSPHRPLARAPHSPQRVAIDFSSSR